MLFTLKRISSKSTGTYGVLIDENNDPFCVTLELPWKENKKNISCIPTGTYNCVSSNSKKYGKVFVVLNVPSRSGILIHRGNYTHNSLGCLLLGEGFSFDSKGEVMISSSGLAYDEFMAKLTAYDRFHLKIVDA